MTKKPLETAIVRNCTFLTSVKTIGLIQTLDPGMACLIITFTDNVQVEYLCPTDNEYYLILRDKDTQQDCVVLYPECKPAQLTFTAQAPC